MNTKNPPDLSSRRINDHIIIFINMRPLVRYRSAQNVSEVLERLGIGITRKSYASGKSCDKLYIFIGKFEIKYLEIFFDP